MDIDADFVVLLFILAFLVLTLKRHQREPRHHTPTPRAHKKKLPNYPGVPKDILRNVLGLTETMDGPPTVPTTPVHFDPPQAFHIVKDTLQKLNTRAPHCDFYLVTLHSASLDKDSDGTSYWSVATTLHERVKNVSIKVIISAVQEKDGTVQVKSIVPETKPLPPDAKNSTCRETSYATYTFPISGI